MKIKALAAALIISATVITNLHAFGLGAQANFSTGDIFAPGAAIVISPTRIAHIAFNWFIDPGSTNIIGLTFDLQPVLVPISTFSTGTVNFTMGIGLFTNVVFDDENTFNGGLRIPIGINILLARNAFEIYTHLAPSFGIHFLPSLGLASPFFPLALGARFWFN